MPLIGGRDFNVSDDIKAPGVTIVNETFARRYFPGEEAIGKSIRFYSTRDPQPPWLQIVGVGRDIRQISLGAGANPEIYVPHAQSAWGFVNFFVRTDADPMSLAAGARNAIQEIDKDQPISNIATLDEVLDGSIADRRGLMFLMAIFAVVAMLLAAVGIYGVISHSVSQRTREIGIRVALGAQMREVLTLILRQGLVLIAAGAGLGLAVAALLTRLISGLLFEVSPTDLITFISVPAILSVVALAACYIPARRALSVDPITALRDE
jgi:putative ABC transport system permease protein